MKKIAIITNLFGVSKLHEKVLKDLFQEKIKIQTYSYDIDIIKDVINADVFVISLYSIYLNIKKYIPMNAKVVILSTTITVEQYDRIKKIPSGSQVLLVNYSAEMALEVMALLRKLGLTQYDFIPVYPGKKNVPKLDIAVTPGESDKVPDFVKNVIDIGHRILDVDTINDIAIKIGCENLLSTERFTEYFKSLKRGSSSVLTLLDRTNTLESRFFELLNVINEGIIATDIDGIILNLNKKACQILRLSEKDIGTCIQKIIEHDSIKQAIQNKVCVDEELIKIDDTHVSFQAVPVKTTGDIAGYLIIINKFEEKEKSQHKLRTQLLGKGLKAKYTFYDIIGESQVIENARNMAKKMALSDLSILITGESGVGKEVFAQAIHNSSKRKNYQFVAVNCAAINENLLESELFGYEEGAFTGAKKGGKMGLFELAHNGTLFLDEMGEMPLALQSRLLRVLQEREVMRIGGDSIIHVDVRIIAATNKNLRNQVSDGQFREDLFYRLNVLPLTIAPLRERGNDILILIEYIKEKIYAKFSFSQHSKEFLLNYDWKGNLRELRNCIEYLAYLEKDVIEIEDLKQHLTIEETKINTHKYETMDDRTFILKCLYESRHDLKGIGRRKIMDLARKNDFYITETGVRRTIHELEENGMAEIRKGRGGTHITQHGIKELMGLMG